MTFVQLVSYRYSFLLGFAICISMGTQAQPMAQQGVINLTKIDFEIERSVDLDGEWGFNWNKFVSPNGDISSADHFVQFPHLWNEDSTLSSYGFASYTLQVVLPKEHPLLALAIPDVYTSYTLYVNGTEIAHNGKVGKSADTTTPFWLPQTASLALFSTDTLSIVLHIANFKHSKGGIRLPIQLGSANYLQRDRTIAIGLELLLSGSLLMIGMFFMALYMFGRNEVFVLYFAFICFVFSYRVIGTGLYPLHYIFPSLPWILTIKAEYFSLYCAATLFCIFVERLYPQEANKKVVYGFASLFGALSLITLLFPPYYFTRLINLFLLLIPFLIVYVTWVYLKAVLNKREGASFALASTVMVFIVFSYNLLAYLTILEGNHLFDFFGYLSFFFLQSLILSYRFTNSLSRARIKAEEAAQAKSQFLSTMSHEIRTPLNAVIGLSELLISSDSQEERKDFALNIKENGVNLLNNILDFSKLESTGVESELKPIQIKKIMPDVKRMLQPLTKGKKLEINTEIYSQVPDWIISDDTLLKQILINLIGNAIKFTEKGSITIQVQKNEDPEIKGDLTFTVRDTGDGIASKDSHLLFKSFSQVDASTTRKHGGTGLGLVISKQLTQFLGGDIWFESEQGKGTTFYFTIKAPETVAPEDFEAIPHIAETTETSSPKNKTIKVLVVEDNLMNQKVITKILEKAQLKPDIAENGLEAVNMVKADRYDLIFMDMEMPIMDGFEATKAISTALPKSQQPIIIAMTANAFQEDKERCLKAGMDDFITKPVSISLVHTKLNEWFP